MDKELEKSIDYTRKLFYENPTLPVNHVARLVFQNCVKSIHKWEISKIRQDIQAELAQNKNCSPRCAAREATFRSEDQTAWRG